MNDNRHKEIALFRLAVLGDLVHGDLRRGELRRALERKSEKAWRDVDGRPCRIAAKTIQSWLYIYKREGFEGLCPRSRKDRGESRAIPLQLQSLILDMKREDPGRSVPLILRELQDAGLMRKGQFSASAVSRFLKARGLSGPKLELQTPARYRFVASACGELWQGDACHGPLFFDPSSGREIRCKIFGLIDDKSRLVPYLRADFHERQEDFLRVLLGAIQRRGIPRAVLLDNHGSFTGGDVRVICAKLGIRLVYTRPRDGASKGKIERFWRTLRAHVLDRLDESRVLTLADLNLRLMTWVTSDYNQRPHAGLSGRTPLSVFEDDAEEIRFVKDTSGVEELFEATVERRAKNDSTVTFRGKTYEVPAHLRREKVRLHYKLLRPDCLCIDDGGTLVPVREVDPVANASRPRTGRGVKSEESEKPEKPTTGLNAVEGLLRRALHPEEKLDEAEEGMSCARS